MTITDFINKEKRRVAYVPTHAFGDMKHPDVQYGVISSINQKFVFVKFDKQVNSLGWEGTTSQACLPESLILL